MYQVNTSDIHVMKPEMTPEWGYHTKPGSNLPPWCVCEQKRQQKQWILQGRAELLI